ncbi:Tyrosine recombinase XerC [termite gut metagenome]|uniref:Tyrosine recombinase XerC n=1 Tax=termite gut metagenome TaxID=433724 RepID=A0A5J4PTA7_9ZZZZ
MKEISKRSTFAVLFYINKAKRKKNGLCLLMGRITIDAGIAQFSAHTEVNPQTWDAKAGRAVGKTKEAVTVNKTLDKLERQIRSHYSKMVSEDAYVTAESVKNALNGIGRRAANLLELFREYNEEVKLRVGVNCVEATYEQYLMSYTHLSEFIRLCYHTDDVALTALNHQFINAYDLYLRVDKRMSAYTVQRHITSLHRMIRRAIKQNTLRRDLFSNYVGERPLQQRRHLTMDEFQKLLNKPIAETHLIRSRDIFLFTCFTGMAYADIRNLSEKHLITDENGFMWIKIKRQKNKQ